MKNFREISKKFIERIETQRNFEEIHNKNEEFQRFRRHSEKEQRNSEK